MKTMTRFLSTLLVVLLLAAPVRAQDGGGAENVLREGKRLLEKGTNQGDPALLQQARAAFERATASDRHAALAHYYVGLADYRLLYAPERTAEKLDLLNDAIDHLEKAVEQDEGFAEAHALLGSMYGQKVAEQWYKGPFLGPKSDAQMEKARALAPENPRVVLLDAIGLYNKPGMFGGDKEKALEGFERAARLFEQENVTNPLQPQWGHEEAYAWLGIAHLQAERPEEARQAFEKALAINPDYGWVKEVLMPQLAEASQ